MNGDNELDVTCVYGFSCACSEGEGAPAVVSNTGTGNENYIGSGCGCDGYEFAVSGIGCENFKRGSIKIVGNADAPVAAGKIYCVSFGFLSFAEVNNDLNGVADSLIGGVPTCGFGCARVCNVLVAVGETNAVIVKAVAAVRSGGGVGFAGGDNFAELADFNLGGFFGFGGFFRFGGFFNSRFRGFFNCCFRGFFNSCFGRFFGSCCGGFGCGGRACFGFVAACNEYAGNYENENKQKRKLFHFV